MANTPKKRAPQQSLALEKLIPVDAIPEKKSGTRNSHLQKVATELSENPNQWYKIGHGRTQSAYQKRKRLAEMGDEFNGLFDAQVRSTDEEGISDIFARFVPKDSPDGS